MASQEEGFERVASDGEYELERKSWGGKRIDSFLDRAEWLGYRLKRKDGTVMLHVKCMVPSEHEKDPHAYQMTSIQPMETGTYLKLPLMIQMIRHDLRKTNPRADLVGMNLLPEAEGVVMGRLRARREPHTGFLRIPEGLIRGKARGNVHVR